MFAHIKHAAIYTQNPGAMIAFYERILGMKRITTAVTEANRGHISDGLIGLAVLARRPGIPGRLGSLRFRSRRYRARAANGSEKNIRKTIITKGLEKVPFAVFRSHDPAGAQFDISERTHEKVREGYKEDGWDQPRQFNHVVDSRRRAETGRRLLPGRFRALRSQGAAAGRCRLPQRR